MYSREAHTHTHIYRHTYSKDVFIEVVVRDWRVWFLEDR